MINATYHKHLQVMRKYKYFSHCINHFFESILHFAEAAIQQSKSSAQKTNQLHQGQFLLEKASFFAFVVVLTQHSSKGMLNKVANT